MENKGIKKQKSLRWSALVCVQKNSLRWSACKISLADLCAKPTARNAL